MRAEFFMSVLLMTTCAISARAQDGREALLSEARTKPGEAKAVSNSAPEEDWPSVSNRTVNVIASARGVTANAVLIKASHAPAIGPFEIDLSNSTNFFAEAEALSRELGSRFAVVADAASDDGSVQTNRTFRSGVVRQMVLKVEGAPMPPSHRKLYVRPQGTGVSAPKAPRLVE